MKAVAIDERRNKAIKLAASGKDYTQIAAELGYSRRSVARKAVVGALRARTVEAVGQLRQLEVGCLDGLQAAVWADALAGDIKAVDAVLRIVQARVKLLGLDQSDVKAAPAGGRLVSAEWRGGLA